MLAQEIDALKEYQAKLLSLDFEDFQQKTKNFKQIGTSLEHAYDEKEFNAIIKLAYDYLGLPSPWGNRTLDDFMNDESGVLKFE
jgi:hypothetical protein